MMSGYAVLVRLVAKMPDKLEGSSSEDAVNYFGHTIQLLGKLCVLNRKLFSIIVSQSKISIKYEKYRGLGLVPAQKLSFSFQFGFVLNYKRIIHAGSIF